MIKGMQDFKTVFFIGVAGVGMSAIAQYLAGIGKQVSGSDRFFKPDVENDTRDKLVAAGVQCFLQDGSGINEHTNLIVVSTAIEETVLEVQKARQMNIPIIKRSELLALIGDSKKTIAVAGTSGKSTTSAMLFDILEYAGMEPSIISGAGLVSIIEEGKIGNAKVGEGDWLVIEADESDGSIVQYHPEIGLLLNVDKDHQEIDELIQLFTTFKKNTKGKFIVNRSNIYSKELSVDQAQDFSVDASPITGYVATDFQQQGFTIKFRVKDSPFTIHTVGKHNMENALAAIAVANQLGVDLSTCAKALEQYKGIYRRHQVIGNKHGVWLIDDYAHNPVKCAASIAACQQVAPKVIAWFQPHGYGPTRFLKNDFIREIAAALRPEDEIWMSEIFYAGGTATKDISAEELTDGIRALGKKAFFVANRSDFITAVKPHLSENSVLLLMGARDPGLEQFGNEIWMQL